MADGDRIPFDKVEMVCTECYRRIPKQAPASCPTCGGRVIIVMLGQGKQAVAELKKRGDTNLSI